LTTTAPAPRRDVGDADDERVAVPPPEDDDADGFRAAGSGVEQIRQFWRKRP
jgi:hypothetical protein